MASREFTFTARADFNQFFQVLRQAEQELGGLGAGARKSSDNIGQANQKILASLRKVRTELGKSVGTGVLDPAQVAAFASQIKALGNDIAPSFRRGTAELERLLGLLQTVQSQQATRGFGRTGQEVLARDVFPSSTSGRIATEGDVLRRIATVLGEINGQTDLFEKGMGDVVNQTSNAATQAEKLLDKYRRAANFAAELTVQDENRPGVRGTTAGRNASNQIQNSLEQSIETLARLQAEIEAKVFDAPLGKAGNKILDRYRAEERAIKRLSKTIDELKKKRLEVINNPEIDDSARQKQVADITDRIVDAERRKAQIVSQSKTTQALKEQLEAASGLLPQLNLIRNELDRIQEVSLLLASDEGLAAGVGQQYFDDIATVQRLSQEIIELSESGDKSEASARRQREAWEELDKTLKRVQSTGSRVLGQVQEDRPAEAANIPRSTDALKSQQGLISRAVFGITDNFVGRFVQTFQFAFAAALQFGAIQAAKRFVEIALDAERAFQDIATNLEFDVSSEQGTPAFDAQLERVRQQVNDVANELNTLPEVVSKSAFVMVARFSSVERAMLALDAQVLAVQVSSISQDETLRALTATAEAFAGATFQTNNALNLQQKLLQREQQSVLLYGKALDFAVRIQQVFGVTVEDSLEGVGRAAETFKLLGFSIEDTFAIVDSVVRKLGLPGQQVAERLNRSIGQLTSPEIQNALLQLSRNSEAFNLTLQDFEDGRLALDTITRQFQELEKVDPTTAQRVLQTIGQRREAEVVAAVLDTGDLQEQIRTELAGAAGAARERFEILRRTVRESLESVNAGVQTLAQNLERLGTLAPVRLLISSFDTFLNTLNTILDGLISFKNFLNEIGQIKIAGLGLADLALSLASIVGAGRIAGSTLAALGQVAAGTSFGGFSVPGFSKGSNLPSIGSKLGGAGAFLFPVRSLSEFKTELKGATGFTGKLKTGFRALLGPIGILLTVISLGFGIYEGLKAADEQIQLLADDLAANRNRLQQEVRLGLRTQSDADFQQAIDTIERTRATPETGGLVNLWDGLVQGILQDFAALGSWDIGAFFTGDFEPENFETQRDRLRRIIEDNVQQAIDSIPQAFNEVLTDLRQFEKPFEIPGGIQTLAESLGPGSISEVLEAELGNILRQLSDPQTSAEQREELVAQAVALYERAQRELEIVEKEFFPEGTPSQIAAESADIAQKFGLGAISYAEAYNTIVGNLEEIDQILASDFPGAEQDRGQFERDRIANIESLQQTVAGQLQRQIDVYQQLADPAASALVEITALQAAIRDLEANFAPENSDKLRQYYLQLQAAQKARTDELTQRAISLTEFELGLARTDSEYFEAVEKVILAYEQQKQDAAAAFAQAIFQEIGKGIFANAAAITAIFENFEFIQEQIDQAVESIRKAAEDRDFASRVAFAGASVFANFAVNDPLADVLSQLAEVYAERGRAFENDAAELENQQRERELLAEKAQIALDRWAAGNLLLAGVNDNLNSLRAELANARGQLDFLGKTVGENSAEFKAAQLSIIQLEQQLKEAELNYENFGRLLELSDPTSAFQKASAALETINARLSTLDFGGEERRAALVERQSAEFAKLAAFYDSALAQARFDFESGSAGEGQYIAFLRNLLDQVDTTTEQGRATWLQINSLIEGFAEETSDLAFNIPTEIRLPTLFEIRRSLAADQLGVNYQDNRQQNITVEVTDEIDLITVMNALEGAFGANVDIESSRLTSGGATLTIGGFN